jgi:hypothetical protein
LANTAASIVGLNHLNNFLKDFPSGIIVETDTLWRSPLFNTLRSRVNSLEFKGGNLFEIEMQTAYSYSGQAFGERSSLPYAGNVSFVKMQLPMKQVIEPAGVTQRALDFATGGDAAWGKIVAREINAVRKQRFPWLMEIAAFGDGTGRLARVVSSSHSAGYITVTCDNTYIDFGWENVRFIKPGMQVVAYNAAGSPIQDAASGGDGTVATKFTVTAVSFGDRNNGTATTGTVTLECTNDLDSGTGATYCFDNGATLYLAGTRDEMGNISDSADASWKYEATNYVGSVDVRTSLPMGLTGIYQTTDTDYDYNDGSIDYTLDTFQGLARASYSTLRPYFFNGTDITGGSGTAGTPGDWDTSTVTDAWNTVYDETDGEVNLILLSSQLATCWDRKNTGQIQVTMDAAKANGWSTYIEGAQYAKPFRAPNGRLIPVVVSKAIPKNVMYGINTDDLHWMTKGGAFDFLPLGEGGGFWRLSPGNRQLLWEAWFGGYTQLAAERCDRAFILQDLADNVS